MAILGKIYDKETHTDKVWYDSSNVFYSKFIENENDNNGQLYVTFKNGATYHYIDVDMPTDYLLFKSGGIDNSQGKALNKQIKGKYEYERVEDIDVSLLLEELNKLNSQENNKEVEEIDWETNFTALYNVVKVFIEDLTKDIENGGVVLNNARYTWEDLKEIVKSF